MQGRVNKTMGRKVQMPEEEWKKRLDPKQYQVLRKQGTEPAFTGKLLNNKDKGMYVCAGCGAELFSSDTKYESGSGWPSFWAATSPDSVEEKADNSFLMKRTEIMCKNCGGHLGHVFEDGPNPSGLRYCVNSLSLDFKKKQQASQPGEQAKETR